MIITIIIIINILKKNINYEFVKKLKLIKNIWVIIEIKKEEKMFYDLEYNYCVFDLKTISLLLEKQNIAVIQWIPYKVIITKFVATNKCNEDCSDHNNNTYEYRNGFYCCYIIIVVQNHLNEKRSK